MYSSWDPDPPNILESDGVKFFALNYIIIHNHISKQDIVWLFHSWGQRLFSGGKFPKVSVRRAGGRGDLFSSQTRGKLKFFASIRQKSQ